ncbi:hypothetical protein BH18ACT6_BH18ACT6_11870 [soil metagenome]
MDALLVRGPRSKKWWLDDNDIRTLNRFEVILEGTSKHKGNRTAALIKLTPSEIGKAAQLLGATSNRRYLCHRAESGGTQTRFDLPQPFQRCRRSAARTVRGSDLTRKWRHRHVRGRIRELQSVTIFVTTAIEMRPASARRMSPTGRCKTVRPTSGAVLGTSLVTSYRWSHAPACVEFSRPCPPNQLPDASHPQYEACAGNNNAPT